MKNISFLDVGALNKTLEKQMEEAFKRVLDNGNYILSLELESFEKDFAGYNHVNYCIGVASGLDALSILLKCYGIGEGDEVIVPSHTFIATWLAVTKIGAMPVPVEPDIETFNINPNLIASAITTKTKAIIPVHLYGRPADLDLINKTAKEKNLLVIADAAQSHGSKYKNKSPETLVHGSATSFYPGKNLGALGDGGAILTNNENIAIKAKELRNYGSAIKYSHNIIGENSRLDEIQAAFLTAKLKLLDHWNEERNRVAKRYLKNINNKNIKTPSFPEDSYSAWHLFVILTANRDGLRNYLHENGIITGIHYPIPPHKQKCYSEFNKMSFPIAEKISNQALSLPMSPLLSDQEVDYISEKINSFIS
jgi:dTDP-4-amino-4,6-dideoxygalactose transaminase